MAVAKTRHHRAKYPHVVVGALAAMFYVNQNLMICLEMLGAGQAGLALLVTVSRVGQFLIGFLQWLPQRTWHTCLSRVNSLQRRTK